MLEKNINEELVNICWGKDYPLKTVVEKLKSLIKLYKKISIKNKPYNRHKNNTKFNREKLTCNSKNYAT